MTAAATLPGIDFEIPIEIVVLGLIAGLTYALLGLGLTLVYRSSRVLNFAHGEMGALPALLIPILVINHRWSYWLALPSALGAAAAIGGLFQFLVIRRLHQASRLTVLVATIAAAQTLFVFNVLLPRGGDLGGRSYPTPFRATVRIGDLVLGAGQLMILVAVPLIVVALTVFLRSSRLGRGSRAAAENMTAARLTGVPAHKVSLAIWVIAGLLAGTSSVLIGPTIPLHVSEALGPGLMLRALAAAMLGGLVSMPGVFAGGVVIGVLEALVIWNYPIGGLLEVVLFAVIVASLLAKRRLGQMARGGESSSWALTASVRALPRTVAGVPWVRVARGGLIVGVVVVAAVLPLPMSNAERFFMTSIPIFALMGLSLVVLTGYAGQVSLGQFAFVGIGAAVGGRILHAGYPHLAGVVWAMAAGAVAALLVGMPALRIRGLFLAVATLGFSVATSAWLFNQSWLVTRDAGGSSLQIARPELLGVDFEGAMAYYWLALAVFVVVAAVVHRLRTAGVGRAMIAVRDNEPAAAALSLSAQRAKLLAFVISGMIAALAGFLYGGLLGNFSSDPGSIFGPAESLALVVMTTLGGMTTITGAVLGALWIRGIPRFFGENFGVLSTGIGVLVVVLILPGGLAALLFRLRDQFLEAVTGWRSHRDRETEETRDTATGILAAASPSRAVSGLARAESAADSDVPVRAEGVSVSFGGVRALDDVSIEARAGEIVGLMGPNGAGKTTLFDVLSGQLRPASGRVLFEDRDITGLSPQARARLGLGRTFQQARLFDELTVVESVSLALERAEPTQVVPSMLGLPAARRSEAAKREQAEEVLGAIGLDAFAEQVVSELTTGTRRLAELACVTALGARVLLLDEPTAGFSHDEAAEFAPVLRSIRDALGATVIVVDHHVPMMVDLVERLYVLEAGVVIAHGDVSILRENERVAAAYLGSMGE